MPRKMLALFFLVTAASALPFGPETTVSSWVELRKACAANGTVIVAPSFKMGPYDGQIVIQGAMNVVIEGNGAVLDATGYPAGKAGFFGIRVDYTGAAPTVSISNLTMTNSFGAAPGADGGAVEIDGGMVTIKDCTFAKNGSPESNFLSGGAVGLSDGVTHIISSTFDSNTGNRGGAIYAVAGKPGAGKVVISQCHFKGNKASSVGGAILADRATVSIAHSTFEDNQAPGRASNEGGGAISANYHSSIFVKSCAFTSQASDDVIGGKAKRGFNDIHRDSQGASVTFECADGKTGKAVAMTAHDLSANQLPPAAEIVHCR